ncbi:MAG: type II toxin-antitoxin system RelE/ParE family toxin [Lewinellaceae bacterium]|nr:type II toxin-antitoxin system RelE/ParE family toxin [Phaeodactylibacter sp.]MCB9352065.1 type II toxin-antitoxin system RelE/ParE family toxin [Lewinellaceae bacterium]
MKVFLSQTAYDQAQDIVDYLEENWHERVRNNFLDKLERSMEIISTMPFAFPPSEKFPGLRKCVITPQTTAYYRVDETNDEVEIITFLDNRRPIG